MFLGRRVFSRDDCRRIGLGGATELIFLRSGKLSEDGGAVLFRKPWPLVSWEWLLFFFCFLSL